MTTAIILLLIHLFFYFRCFIAIAVRRGKWLVVDREKLRD